MEKTATQNMSINIFTHTYISVQLANWVSFEKPMACSLSLKKGYKLVLYIPIELNVIYHPFCMSWLMLFYIFYFNTVLLCISVHHMRIYLPVASIGNIKKMRRQVGNLLNLQSMNSTSPGSILMAFCFMNLIFVVQWYKVE